jgi:hypothetical protein
MEGTAHGRESIVYVICKTPNVGAFNCVCYSGSGNRQKAMDKSGERMGCNGSISLARFVLIARKKRYGAVLLAPRRIYHHSREGGQLHCGWQWSRNGLNQY